MSRALTVGDSETASVLTPPAPAAWSDWVGVVASVGCAIHCAAMPFVIAYLPALGLSFLADEAFHKWMAVACFVIALAAFVPGFRKHGRLTPVIIASVGLMMITVAAFGFAGECCASCEDLQASGVSTAASGCADAGCEFCAEKCAAGQPAPTATGSASLTASPVEPSTWLGRLAPWLTPVGGIVLVSAHLLNRRYGCLCGCCGSESSDEESE